GINQKQLIILGMLVGTDYNEGIKGVGPKTGLKIVKEHKTLGEVLKKVEWKSEVDASEVFDFFLKPPVTDGYDMEWKEPDREKLIEFMVEGHDFSRERVEKMIEKLQQSSKAGKQSSLKGWFEK
ncbi:MAG TPA: flap structure-specific endonuclease, partial [archaeon]|nr:flap structure-specific endonuclease [archaeon]